MVQPTLSLTDLLTAGSNGRLTIEIYSTNNQPMIMPPISLTSSSSSSTVSVQANISVNFNSSNGNQTQNVNKSYTGTPQQVHDSLTSDIVIANFLGVY